MQGLHENQKKILEYLLDKPGGCPLEEIAAHLGVTKTAAREHVLKIEALGLLQFEDSKGEVGRPKRRYRLSPRGLEAFPRQYSWLSNEILALLVGEFGADGASRLMQKLAGTVADSMRERFERKTSPAARLAEVSAALNELGYRASVKQSDLRKGAVLEATNCVYHTVAKAHPELCAFDIKFIEKASGGLKVSLESCIARGGSVCRFCLRKP
jgi:predicted ArsR family transcriptional regulator